MQPPSPRILRMLLVLELSMVLTGSVSAFRGRERADLPEVTEESGWGLEVVMFDVGWGDSMLLRTPAGPGRQARTCLIDAGTYTAGPQVARKLRQRGITHLDLVYVTHHHRDHQGGLSALLQEGFTVGRLYDLGRCPGCALWDGSGPERRRSPYGWYVRALGDADNDGHPDDGSWKVERRTIRPGLHEERLGGEQGARIRCLTARGEFGPEVPAPQWHLEDWQVFGNAGSMALLITLGEFELYTAGDQTDDDWLRARETRAGREEARGRGAGAEDDAAPEDRERRAWEPEVETAVLRLGLLGGEADLDVVKTSHHGSFTATSAAWVSGTTPEVALISGGYRPFRHPRQIVLKQYQIRGCHVLITGDGRSPSSGQYARARVDEEQGFRPDPAAIHNRQGDITIRVSPDGRHYSVTGRSFRATFSAVDADNRPVGSAP